MRRYFTLGASCEYTASQCFFSTGKVVFFPRAIRSFRAAIKATAKIDRQNAPPTFAGTRRHYASSPEQCRLQALVVEQFVHKGFSERFVLRARVRPAATAPPRLVRVPHQRGVDKAKRQDPQMPLVFSALVAPPSMLRKNVDGQFYHLLQE